MAYLPLTNIVPQFFDSLGDPLVGGTLSAFIAGTSTPTNLFSDSSGTVAGTVITLDYRGEPTIIKLLWVDTSINYKLILKDSTGATLWTEDNISVTGVEDGSITEAKLANNAVTASKIASNAVTNSKIASSAITNDKFDSTVQLSYRNRLINGNMIVDQRNSGVSQTFTAAAAIAYCVDRWHAKCTGANITGAQLVSGGRTFYRFTGAASNTGLEFGQRIESINSRDMAGKGCVLSLKASSTSITSLTWTAYYANSTDTFSAKTQIATGTFTITSTEATYTTTVSVPAAATTGIEIVISCGALLAAQTLTITDVQFEIGSSGTSFENRLYISELSMAQRYYERETTSTSFICSTDLTITAPSRGYKVSKRASPTLTVTVSGGSGAAFSSGPEGFRQSTANSTKEFVDWIASAEL